MGQRLGQHFLHDKSVLNRIAAEVCEPGEPLVVEIGAGRGALTDRLVGRAGRVVAVELDSSLAAGLRARYGDRVAIIESDVQDVDLRQWGEVVVCGNVPYYLTSPILDQVLRIGPALKKAVFLIQMEVARRLVARPGSRDYGFLSVRTQARARPEILFPVRPGAFLPPPKVESAAVRLTPAPRWSAEETAAFLKFAGLCFQQKRKTLRNNLKAIHGARVDDLNQRAEQLSLDELFTLWRSLREPLR